SNAINNRGNALLGLRRMDEALAAFDRAVALDPANAEAHANRGVALSDLGRPVEAVTAYEAALAIRPDFLEALNGLGIALEALGLEPDHADAHWNRALQLLLRGDYAEGWAEYEWRWRQPSFRDGPIPPGPKWLGETPIAGKRLLIVSEQGFGDTLQMMRYANL